MFVIIFSFDEYTSVDYPLSQCSPNRLGFHLLGFPKHIECLWGSLGEREWSLPTERS